MKDLEDLEELKRVSCEFTNMHVEAIYCKVRFDMRLSASRADIKAKDAAAISGGMAYYQALMLIERLEDQIVWNYMTHLGIDTDFDEHFDRDD